MKRFLPVLLLAATAFAGGPVAIPEIRPVMLTEVQPPLPAAKHDRFRAVRKMHDGFVNLAIRVSSHGIEQPKLERDDEVDMAFVNAIANRPLDLDPLGHSTRQEK